MSFRGTDALAVPFIAIYVWVLTSRRHCREAALQLAENTTSGLPCRVYTHLVCQQGKMSSTCSAASFTNRLRNNEQASQSYVTTDGQSASLSWFQSHILGPWLDFYCCQTVVIFLMRSALITIFCCLKFETQAWTGRSPYLYPSWAGWPVAMGHLLVLAVV
jgi:hypothetical protein